MKATGLLRVRDFRLLWIGETTSCLGSSIGGVSLPLVALLVLHASVLAVSALTAAAWLPWLVIGLPAGAWVDRLPRRRVMIIVLRDPLIRVTTLYGCMSNFLLVGYQAVLIVFLVKVVGLNAGLAGLLLALTSPAASRAPCWHAQRPGASARHAPCCAARPACCQRDC